MTRKATARDVVRAVGDRTDGFRWAQSCLWSGIFLFLLGGLVYSGLELATGRIWPGLFHILVCSFFFWIRVRAEGRASLVTPHDVRAWVKDDMEFEAWRERTKDERGPEPTDWVMPFEDEADLTRING